jgi:uroporphyrinogen decarboxylase
MSSPADRPARRKLSFAPSPDFSRLERVLRRQGEPDRVPFFELHSQLGDRVLADLGIEVSGGDPDTLGLRRHIAYLHALGYDYCNAGVKGFGFPIAEQPKAMTAHGERTYFTAAAHTIAGWRDFETYPWPDLAAVDPSPLEEVKRLLPDGMRVIAGSAGVLENVMWLLGAEGLAWKLADDEPFVAAMFEKVGSRIAGLVELQASFDSVGAMVMGGDMGFSTQTLVSPAVLRKYVFPWHRRIVAASHRHGKPIILHSCGNLEEVMEDIIACGWDAKHSFEDKIEPVWEAKQRWGSRIAVLGGFDMDRIVRSTVPEVRAHTRTLIERCATGGGWALGTGNSVPDYVPVENYLAMLEEGFHAGRRG